MAVLTIYEEDLRIAQALLRKDEATSKSFWYKDCYPLFLSIFKNYETGCLDCLEFMNEIYLLVLTPSPSTGRCQLENYKGESSLKTWLKTVCLFYCYRQHKLALLTPKFEPCTDNSEFSDTEGDRNDAIFGSTQIDFSDIERNDVLTIIGMMPNRRYARLIELRHVEMLSDSDTAEALGMTLANYYNKHRLAKEQFKNIYRKEADYGTHL